MPVYSTVDDNNLHIGTAYWLKYIRQRVDNNQDFICPIVGKTGSGKSESALSMMQLLNGKVKEENYFFKASDFLKRVCFLDENNIKGEVILWDEIGTGLSAQQWQSRINKTMGPVFQTIRRNNLVILFTLPYFSFLDASLRKLVHGLWETKRIDRPTSQTVLKPLVTQTNQDTGKLYKKFLKAKVEGKGIMPIKRIYLPRADLEAVKVYEEKAKEYKQSITQKALATILAQEAKENSYLSKELSSQEAFALQLLEEHKTQKACAAIMGISERYASEIFRCAKQKVQNGAFLPKKLIMPA